MVDTQTNWVKKNKLTFAKDLIKKSGAKSGGNLSAVFMAGLPGAGKTEFARNLITASELKVVYLDMDEIATEIKGYRPEKADSFRGGASELLNKAFDLTLNYGLDFIMDGTFGSQYAIKNIDRSFRHRYSVRIIYIHQDPRTAWQFTMEREKVEHRAIDIDGFVEVYFNILNNLKLIMHKHYDKIMLDAVVKDTYNKIGNWHRNIDLDLFDKITENNYNKETLRSYIND